MKITRAKASNYNTVDPENLVRYIREYAEYINNEVQKSEVLDEASRAALKAIAVELETVKKRLDYILHNRY